MTARETKENTVGASDDALVQSRREQELTEEVARSFEQTPDARLRQVLQSLTRHLHAFIRDVRLTSAEWDAAIDFLTRAGHITDDKRQEFILLSDVLGASMMTVGVNAPAQGNATESTVFGPFFAENSPEIPLGGDIAEGVDGKPCWVSGTVRDTAGDTVAGARIEVWFADESGLYDAQYEGDVVRGRGHLFSAEDGSYGFWAITPPPYPIPFDGPVGDLLRATQRSYYRPAHVHFLVTAPGRRELITHVFVAGSEYLDRDAVFGVKESLVLDFVPHPPATAHGRVLEEEWDRLDFDIVLAVEGHIA